MTKVYRIYTTSGRGEYEREYVLYLTLNFEAILKHEYSEYAKNDSNRYYVGYSGEKVYEFYEDDIGAAEFLKAVEEMRSAE